MKRLSLSLVVLLTWAALAWGQGQLINGHRTMTGGLNTGTTTGSANAYVLTLNPALPGYVTWQCFTFLANHPNTAAATLNVNSRGALTLKKWVSGVLSDLASGDIATGQYTHVCYDGAVLQVQSGSGGAGGGGGGTGDVTSIETGSASGQLVLFAGTIGKSIQGYEGGAGLVKTSATGIPSPAVAGTDYATPGSVAGKQDTLTWGAGLALTATTASVASQEPGFLSSGTTLVCGSGQAGRAQVTPSGEWQYCGAEPTPLLHSGLPTQSGLTWNVTPGTCTGDASGGKLTLSGSQIVCSSDLSGGGGGGSNTFNASDFTVTGVDVALDYANAQKATAVQPGFLSASDFTAFAAKQAPLTWGAGLVASGDDIRVASEEAGFLTTGTVDLTEGSGAGGKMQVRADGSLEYTDGATLAVRHRVRGLPHPFTWNVGTGSACKTDPNLGALTINASDQIVCKSDVSGGGGGPGDLTAFGNIASGEVATTGFPLTNMWWLESGQPILPPSGQGVPWLDSTSKNFSLLTSDGVVKRMVQSVTAVPNQVLTALAPDGSFSQMHLSSANLSDGSGLARLAGPQIVTGTQLVPRPCTLSASSGTVSAPNADLCDVFERHDVGGTLTIPAPTASGLNPRPQHPLTFSLCAAAAQTVAWDSAYATRYGVPLPTTIPAGGCVGTLAKWNVFSGKWELWGSTPDSLTSVSAGGTSVTTLTGVAVGNGTSPFTGVTSSTVGHALLVTGANTFGFGPVAAGGGTGTFHLGVGGYSLPASNPAVLDASGTWLELKFDNATRECALWQGRMNADYVSGLTLKAPYKTAATSSSFHLDVRLKVSTPGGGTSMDALAFATNNDCNDATVPGTPGAPDEISCPLANTGGIAAGLTFQLELCRDVANDGAAAKVALVTPSLEYQR